MRGRRFVLFLSTLRPKDEIAETLIRIFKDTVKTSERLPLFSVGGPASVVAAVVYQTTLASVSRTYRHS